MHPKCLNQHLQHSSTATSSATTTTAMRFITSLFVLSIASSVKAGCECGFRDEKGMLWMDGLVLPSDKLGDINNNNDIFLNDYVHSRGHGNYTYSVQPGNVYTENGDLVLKVAPPVGTTIGSAQASSRRKDLFYGTYRSEILMPPQEGSCVGFFHYYNDTEEVDIEYIGQNKDMLYFSSKRTNPQDFSTDIDYLNAVMKTPVANVYRDYRFDWTKDKVDFFVDDKLYYSATSSVPSTPARFMLMNWGNGDKDWSDLPKENIYAKVRNVRVFFNSTHPYIISNYDKVCTAAREAGKTDTVCSIASFSKTEKYGFEENVIRRFAVTGKLDTAAPSGTTSSAPSSLWGRESSTSRTLWSIVLVVFVLIQSL